MKTEELLEALAALRRSLEVGDTIDEALLRRVFASKSDYVLVRACSLVGDFTLRGFEGELIAAFERGFQTRDGGAQLKTAAAEALDLIESEDAAPFERGVAHVQREGGVDVAAPLRARCLFALVRLRVSDALTRIADALSDPEDTVRAAGARAAAYHGDDRGAPLLRLKLRVGDAEPDIVTDVLKAYLTLDPRAALPFARGLLASKRTGDRLGAALALGESRVNGALEPLLEYESTSVREEEVRVALFALAALRDDAATKRLRERIEGDDELRSTWAARALEPY